jgi:hypothetical protein
MTRPRYLIAPWPRRPRSRRAAACGSSGTPASGPGSTSGQQPSHSSQTARPSAPTTTAPRHPAGLLAVHSRRGDGHHHRLSAHPRHGRDFPLHPGPVDPAVTQATSGFICCLATPRRPAAVSQTSSFSAAEPAWAERRGEFIPRALELRSCDATTCGGNRVDPEPGRAENRNNEVRCGAEPPVRSGDSPPGSWPRRRPGHRQRTRQRPHGAAPALRLPPHHVQREPLRAREFCPIPTRRRPALFKDGKTITREQSGGSYRWVSGAPSCSGALLCDFKGHPALDALFAHLPPGRGRCQDRIAQPREPEPISTRPTGSTASPLSAGGRGGSQAADTERVRSPSRSARFAAGAQRCRRLVEIAQPGSGDAGGTPLFCSYVSVPAWP